MRQNVYLKMPLSELKEHFEQIVSAGYSVSLFTDWQNENINEVWIKSLVAVAPEGNARNAVVRLSMPQVNVVGAHAPSTKRL